MQLVERLENWQTARELLEQNRIPQAIGLVRQEIFETELPLAETEQQLMRQLGVACHLRMMDLRDSDPETAINLAEAGSKIFNHLQRQGAIQPDWVAIHEEQFWRYGAILIHQQLSSKAPGLDPGLAEHRRLLGLAWLARLNDFYAEPPHWLAVMRQQLEVRAPDPAPRGPFRIAVVGNCQTHPLFLGLCQSLPDHPIHFCTPVHMATPHDVSDLHRELAHIDLLVMHRVLPGYRGDIGLDGPTLKALLQPGARQLVLPNLHYEGYHPLIGYAHLPQEQRDQLAAESPLGDYHDFLAMAASAQGLTASTVLQRPLLPPMAELLRQWHASSLEQLRQREAECDVALSNWIETHYIQRPLFHTFNHPSNLLLEQLLAAVLKHIAPDRDSAPPHLGDFEHLGQNHHGVLPWVAQALGLGPWALEGGRRDWSMPWSLVEQLQGSIDYYGSHPEIVEVNRSLEKYRLAEQLVEIAF